MSENLLIGLEFLVLRLGFVWVFWCILVGAMYVMSMVVGYLNKIFPEAVEVVERKSKKVASSEDDLIAVALAAIVSKK